MNLSKGGFFVEHFKIINEENLINCEPGRGCGECQVSCQSAVKTSSAVANQKCENTEIV